MEHSAVPFNTYENKRQYSLRHSFSRALTPLCATEFVLLCVAVYVFALWVCIGCVCVLLMPVVECLSSWTLPVQKRWLGGGLR